jgi:hypothetical protein
MRNQYRLAKEFYDKGPTHREQKSEAVLEIAWDRYSDLHIGRTFPEVPDLDSVYRGRAMASSTK